MTTNNFCELTPEIMELSKKCSEAATIDPELYGKYDVKRGLRDLNGKGVLVGLTEISDVCSTKIVDGKSVPADGSLYYRGYNVEDIIKGIDKSSHFGFEECTYLLLFGKLPTKEELQSFCALLSGYRTLPTSFVRDIIMKAPSKDMMNTLGILMMTVQTISHCRMFFVSVFSSSVCFRCYRFMAIRLTTTIMMVPAFLSMLHSRNSLLPRRSCMYCVLTANTHH